MLSFAAMVLLLLSAFFPSMRLDGTATADGLHLAIAKERKEAFQVRMEINPGLVVEGKLSVIGDTHKSEATFTDFKLTPAPKDKPEFPTEKLELDDHHRPVKLAFPTPWADLLSLLGALPVNDFALGKEYPYNWTTQTYPVKGNAIYKGEVENDLVLISTGKAKMGERNLDLKHKLLFPKAGGPVREIDVELSEPGGMSVKWTAKRIP